MSGVNLFDVKINEWVNLSYDFMNGDFRFTVSVVSEMAALLSQIRGCGDPV